MNKGTIGHTPGPWEFSSGGIWAISPWNARVKIATVTTFSPMNGIDSNANGHALAAAAELLAALKSALDEALSYDTEFDHNVINTMSTVIAKAEGRS